MPQPAPAGAHADWGKWAKKLEVLLILRIPAEENRDPRRIVPGRPNVYIIPSSDCVPGIDGDTLSYYSNTNIEKVLILKRPNEGTAGTHLLDSALRKGLRERVQIISARDNLGGMSDVELSIVPTAAYAPKDIIGGKDKNPTKPWRWSVARTTAFVTAPSDPASLYIDRHRWLQDANPDKKLWPENIARFTPDEMEAALHSIKQQQLRSYTLAFLYTTKSQAVEMCQKGLGIDSSCTVTTQSPVDFGWEKNAGGFFKENAARAVGQQKELLQAVLLLGLPTHAIKAHAGVMFSIPQELLMEVDGGKLVYANAHVLKSYVLLPEGNQSVLRDGSFCLPGQAHPSERFNGSNTTTHHDFAPLSAEIKDGYISEEEAFATLRARYAIQNDFLDGAWSILDEDGSGSLDVSRFAILQNAVEKATQRVAMDDVVDTGMTLTTQHQTTKAIQARQRAMTMAKISALEQEREELLHAHADTQHHGFEIGVNEHSSRHQNLNAADVRPAESSEGRHLPSPPTAPPSSRAATALRVVKKLREKKKLAQGELKRRLAENQSQLNRARELLESLDTRPAADDGAAIDERAQMLQARYQLESESLRITMHANETNAKTKLRNRVRRKSLDLSRANELPDNL